MAASIRGMIVALLGLGACVANGAQPEKLGTYWPTADDGVFRGIVIEADLNDSMHSSFEVRHVLPDDNWKRGGVVLHGRVTGDDGSAFHFDYAISYDQMAELLRKSVVVQPAADAKDSFDYVLFDQRTNRLGTVTKDKTDTLLDVTFESLAGDKPVHLRYQGTPPNVDARMGKAAGAPVTDSWSTDLAVAAVLIFADVQARDGSGVTWQQGIDAAKSSCTVRFPGEAGERVCIASMSLTYEGSCSFNCKTHAECCGN